uniref:CSON002368 protein n=1 Tax=Culicoides sonorensis TaxID=179676 RepID=A0A336MMQ4_CULSO
MSAMPVVWCTNPNSSEKPTAFALQGIQLQGNISDQHVLAVQELIAAASEGRLILPSDGAVVLLDCGVGVGSVVLDNNCKDKNKFNDYNNLVQGDQKKDSSSTASSSVLCDNKLLIDSKSVVIHKADVHTINEEEDDSSSEKQISINNNVKINNDNCDIIERNRSPSQLYEFLCCAKCMSDGVSRCFANGRKKSIDNEKLIAKYLDKTRRHSNYSVSSSNAYRDEATSRARGIRKNSFKLRTTPSTINLNCNLTNENANDQKIFQDESDTLIKVTSIKSENTNTTCRKTSLDSICTVSSLDSGFIEMQNKLSAGDNNHNNNKNQTDIEIIVSEPEHVAIESDLKISEEQAAAVVSADQEAVKKCVENNSKLINDNNLLTSNKTTTQQSRNRRKSYEEFKSMFRQNNEKIPVSEAFSHPDTHQIPCHENKILEVVPEDTTKPVKELGISRRKSYEEFKQLVKICDNDLNLAINLQSNGNQNANQNNSSDYKSVANSVYYNNNSTINNSSVYDVDQSEDYAQNVDASSSAGMKRKNSKRHSLSKKDRLMNIFHNNKIESTDSDRKFSNCDKIYDIIRKHPSKTDTNLGLNKYRHSSSSSKNFKIYDKFITYGTIYDIIQKKAELYDTDLKQFEKYMTYGTIYEILRHKSDAVGGFPRRRVFSEKIYRQLRNNLLLDNIGHRYSTIHESMGAQRINAITHKSSHDDTQSSESEVWNNTNTLSTIYDILQTSKNRNLHETDGKYELMDDKSNKNRFLVKKVSEDDLSPKKNLLKADECDSTSKESKSNIDGHKKQTRLRRFSNILSYKREKSPLSSTSQKKASTISAPEITIELVSTKNSLKEPTPIKNTNQLNVTTQSNIKTPGDSMQKTDELYSRINKLNLGPSLNSLYKSYNGNTNHRVNLINNNNNNMKKVCDEKDKENRNFKENSSQDTSKQNNNEKSLEIPSRKDRKISANAKFISDKPKLCEHHDLNNQVKADHNKSNGEKTRRLSEFTRGEFLNEKQ